MYRGQRTENYHTGPPANFEHNGICSRQVAERRMEGGLRKVQLTIQDKRAKGVDIKPYRQEQAHYTKAKKRGTHLGNSRIFLYLTCNMVRSGSASFILSFAL